MNRNIKYNEEELIQYNEKFKGMLIPIEDLRNLAKALSQKEIGDILSNLVYYTLYGKDETNYTKEKLFIWTHLKERQDHMLKKFKVKEAISPKESDKAIETQIEELRDNEDVELEYNKPLVLRALNLPF